MRFIVLASVCLVLLLAGGCAKCKSEFLGRGGFPHTPVAPPPGFIYQHTKAPLSTNFHATPARPGKTGRSLCHYVGIPFYPILSITWQDPASVKKAAANGGIDKVAYADYEVMRILGVYTQFTIHAYGE